ncbi:MAG: DinB family protein [Candidatus Hermodarchaeota archaeon]
MNAEHTQRFYEYHFAMNRNLWDYCLENLTTDQFNEETGISAGSIRKTFVHIMSSDERWFRGLRGEEVPEYPDAAQLEDLEVVRKRWEGVEAMMREYLEGLTDSEMSEPFERGIDRWHALFHVVNHGTHHRGQIVSMLRILGIKPVPQDFVFFVLGRI